MNMCCAIGEEVRPKLDDSGCGEGGSEFLAFSGHHKWEIDMRGKLDFRFIKFKFTKPFSLCIINELQWWFTSNNPQGNVPS